ncbi:MAG: DMT family transporter [Alphaproteobacteria bacterium]|nr:DMT family transporter [Alphaproteobacteria bacterium]
MARPAPGLASFRALPGGVRGALWMGFAALAFAAGFVVIRYLSARYSVYELALFRSGLAAVLMLPWAIGAWRRVIGVRRWRIYLLYALTMYAGILCWFFALAHLPTAEATALYFTTPLFTIVIAAVFLGEKVGLRRWTATLIGFLGALVIIRPGVVAVSLPVIAVLATAFLFAIANVAIKALAATDGSNTVVFHGFLLVTIAGVVPALDGWVTPSWADMPWILFAGVSGLVSQQCFTRAVAAAPISVVMPPYFLQLPFAALFAWILFAELPSVYVWAGAAIICGSSYYIALREAQIARAGAAAARS